MSIRTETGKRCFVQSLFCGFESGWSRTVIWISHERCKLSIKVTNVTNGVFHILFVNAIPFYPSFCEDVVLVYDAQPRNRDIVRGIEKSIKNGYKVALLPYD